MKGVAPLLCAIAVAASLVLVYVALGGASYEPTPVADPCAHREGVHADGLQTVLEQAVLTALDAAACRLGVSREDLVLGIRNESALDALAKAHGFSREDAANAVQDAVSKALGQAEEAGAIGGFTASLIERLAGELDPWRLIEALEKIRDFLP